MKNYKLLLSGVSVPATIRTDERIFQAYTYEEEVVLCNLGTANLLISHSVCKVIKHLWNNKFTVISKKEVMNMHHASCQ